MESYELSDAAMRPHPQAMQSTSDGRPVEDAIFLEHLEYTVPGCDQQRAQLGRAAGPDSANISARPKDEQNLAAHERLSGQGCAAQ